MGTRYCLALVVDADGDLDKSKGLGSYFLSLRLESDFDFSLWSSMDGWVKYPLNHDGV